MFQSCMGLLSVVCKTFHRVFRAHPEVFCYISVSSSMLIKAESSTLAWLQAQGPVVWSFRGAADPAQAAKCLVALSHANSILRYMDINCSPTTRMATTMNRLGSSTAVTTCCLKSDRQEGMYPVDLAPLQALHKLTSLRLEKGAFMNINVALHLTDLSLHAHKSAETTSSGSW